MSITINAKGTSCQSFKIGKTGMSLSDNGTISLQSLDNLTVSADEGLGLVVNSANGIGVITTNNTELAISATAGGGQYLTLNNLRWPSIDGANGQVLGTNGSGVLSWVTPSTVGRPTPEVKTSAFVGVNNGIYACNTSASSFSASLPSSPQPGWIVTFIDYSSTFDTGNLTINRNGSNIMGVADNYVLNQKNQGRTFIYVDATKGWMIYA